MQSLMFEHSSVFLECTRKTCLRCTTSSLCSPSCLNTPRSSSRTHRCLTHTCTCSQELGCSNDPCNPQSCHTPMRRCCLDKNIPSPCTFPLPRTLMTHGTP